MAKLETITGKAISGEWGLKDEDGTGIPVLRTTNFTNEGIVDFSSVVTRNITKKDLSLKYLRPGDIIIEKSGGSDKQPVGRVVYYSGDENKYLFNNFTGVLRVIDSSSWDSKYLFYALYANYLKGGTRKYQNKTTGLHNLKTDQYVKEFEVQDHPVQVQQQITAVLDKICSLIFLRKQQLTKLDELLKAKFVEMFGDPVSNPMNWAARPLGNECSIITGNTPSRKVAKYYGNYIEWIKSDNINTPQAILTVAEEGLSKEGLAVGRSVDSGSILMTCIAGSIGCIGNVAIANRRVAFNQQINGIIPNSNNVWFMYTQFELSKKAIQSSINMALKGILSKGQLSEMKFIFPPIALQDEYGYFAAQVDESNLKIQQSLDKLEVLKKALMQEYFR